MPSWCRISLTALRQDAAAWERWAPPGHAAASKHMREETLNNARERRPSKHGLDTGLQPFHGVKGHAVFEGKKELLDGPEIHKANNMKTTGKYRASKGTTGACQRIYFSNISHMKKNHSGNRKQTSKNMTVILFNLASSKARNSRSSAQRRAIANCRPRCIGTKTKYMQINRKHQGASHNHISYYQCTAKKNQSESD